ncbi:hypothetical protein MKZ38_004371 [Zalerion maritima]|uniref:Uncharacterized protein n=1 Tax=Zalerion maritima TaxID=339359 RepID=A0AAD5RMS8_9PEZI|nr:hypothetical protein MKZ38_004371 [Zalerion maritima]
MSFPFIQVEDKTSLVDVMAKGRGLVSVSATHGLLRKDLEAEISAPFRLSKRSHLRFTRPKMAQRRLDKVPPRKERRGGTGGISQNRIALTNTQQA